MKKFFSKILLAIVLTVASALAVSGIIYVYAKTYIAEVPIEVNLPEQSMLSVKEQSNPTDLNIGYASLGYSTFSTAAASTTPKYQGTGTASSSIIASVKNSKTGELRMQVTSSSTPPIVYWQYASSRDGIDWYPFDCQEVNDESASTTKAVGASGCIQTWTTPATTTIGEIYKKRIQLPELRAEFLRTQFWVSGANSDIYAEVADFQENQ